MGLLLYGLGFIIVGGEWFAMWQSKTWNGQQTAFEFMGMIGVVLVIVLQAESTD
jgi:predicted small integral membrane protein